MKVVQATVDGEHFSAMSKGSFEAPRSVLDLHHAALSYSRESTLPSAWSSLEAELRHNPIQRVQGEENRSALMTHLYLGGKSGKKEQLVRVDVLRGLDVMRSTNNRSRAAAAGRRTCPEEAKSAAAASGCFGKSR